MRKFILFAVFALVVAAGTGAYAELKNVEIGGMLRFRGERMDPWLFDDDTGPGQDFISTTTRLNIGAELTEGVSALIELQQIEVWGTLGGPLGPSPGIDPASPGVPSLLNMEDDFGLYQGYILIQDVGGYEGLALKIGRQEITFGTEFFLGNNDFGPGLSHDAIAAILAPQDDLTVILVAAKLAEGLTVSGTEDDADIDLYGICSSYTGMEDLVVDGYFIFIRSADLAASGPLFPPVAPIGATDQESSELYTIGARVGGMWDALDYNLEGAFQFGDNGWGGDFEGWAVDAGIGYTFDMDMQPRLGFNYTFSSGDDGELDEDTETFLAPIADNYHKYGYMDLFGLGNMNVFKLSATASPHEKIGVGLHALHFLAVEHEDTIAPL
jgi:hypothetical protein